MPVKVTTAPMPVWRAAKALASAPRSNGASCTRISITSASGHWRKERHLARTGEGCVEIPQLLIDRNAQRREVGEGHRIPILALAQLLDKVHHRCRRAVHPVLGVADAFAHPCEIKHIHQCSSFRCGTDFRR